MERSVALKKVEKLLGKSFRYRVNLKAPNADGRAEARKRLEIAESAHSSVSRQLSARTSELLRGDLEYQRLSAEYKSTREKSADLRLTSSSYRFTVFVSSGFFTKVEAEGDSWEEIIDQLNRKRGA
ncbi:hypothetical protein [Rhodopseudomonas palustris]|uniref:hypothetical protein n=1 Tax=Rhodopseudomonas palustris TaxID=1076 RepID=UPI0012D3905A|nr:hypothetical protein [Rhodopseudomonas palustris]